MKAEIDVAASEKNCLFNSRAVVFIAIVVVAVHESRNWKKKKKQKKEKNILSFREKCV